MWILGMDINLLWLMLVVMTVGVTMCGLITFTECTPAFFVDLFLYGKVAKDARASINRRLEVPKHWFSHFYVLATAHSLIWWTAAAGVYFMERPLPDWLDELLSFLAGGNRRQGTSAEATFLVLTLLLTHTTRRLYECWFVHAHSDAKMSLGIYAAGLVHYLLVPPSLVAEAPGFVGSELQVHHGLGEEEDSQGAGTLRWLHLSLDWRNVSIWHFVWTFVYFYSASTQHKSFRTLARLRRGGSKKYVLPVGGWFELVSSPHFTCEVVIYWTWAFILGLKSRTSLMLAAWVTVNQLVTALVAHFWYQDRFPDYPKERKALIPYIL